MVLLRVVFCQIFPHLDRILTIDNDTIVRENISEFDVREFYVQLVNDLKNRGY